jgi:hypothetical protein
MINKLFNFGIYLVFSLFLLSACNNKEKKEAARQDQYETSKKTIEEIEKESPLKFITVTSTNKRNIVGQTVVKGVIKNKATTVSYKDFTIKVSFFSKTGTLLEEDEETIMEKIEAGDEFEFKSKFFAAKGSEEVELKVIAAKVAN